MKNDIKWGVGAILVSIAAAVILSSWAPAPAFAIRLAVGEMADMLLGGAKVVPKKLLDAGYSFKYDDADAALTAVYKG